MTRVEREFVARERRRLLVLGLGVLGWILALHAAGLSAALLHLSPVLLVLVLLLGGRYPGERLLHRLAPTPHAPRPNPSAPCPRRALTFFPRGGLLLAASLAGRGPPLRGHA
jgi:hypothetical protein